MDTNETPAPILNAQKLVEAPFGQPWLLMTAGRASYNGRPVHEVATGILSESAQRWQGSATLEGVAEHVLTSFADQDDLVPAPEHWLEGQEGTPSRARFVGLVCGYAERGSDAEAWVVESREAGGNTLAADLAPFVSIGCGLAAYEAEDALTDLVFQDAWLREEVGWMYERSALILPPEEAGHAVLAVMRALARDPGGEWASRGVGGEWTGRTIRRAGVAPL